MSYSSIKNQLQAVLPNKKYWDSKNISAIHGATIDGQSFFRNDMNRFYAKDAIFRQCDFSRAACDSSRFYNVEFESCDFSGATFQDAQFVDCSFSGNTKCVAANFSRSAFIGCKFDYMMLNLLLLLYLC